MSGVALGASRALASISEDLIGAVAPPLASCAAVLAACAAGLLILDEGFWSARTDFKLAKLATFCTWSARPRTAAEQSSDSNHMRVLNLHKFTISDV